MSRFFPSVTKARESREVYVTGALAEAVLVLESGVLETPGTNDWRDMVEEFCALLESLGVPDRDGADIGVIVPLNWLGSSSKRLVSVDIGRRALAFARQTPDGPSVMSDEVYLEDPLFAKSLRDALIPTIATYKNEGASAGD